MTTYFDDINEALFKLGDLATFASRDVTQSITDMSVSLSLSGSSEISVTVVDPNFTYASANYFQVRRDIFYRDLWFEIAAVETQRSESVHPQYTIQCRSKAVQLMKRDKKPEAYRGMTGYDFAQAMAKRFAMNFVGERTTKKQAIVKGKSKNSDDSVWTVLSSLASEQNFICFESSNTLFFCSEKFLLGKWGDPEFVYGDFKFVPFVFPEPNPQVLPGAKDKYVLLEQPRLRRSDDDVNAAEGSMIVDRFNGKNLRPGMTIYLAGIPDFEGFYIITDVSFNEGTPEPVQVSFRVPVDPTKEKISTNGTKQTPSSGNTNTTTNPISEPTGNKPNPAPTTLSTTAARTYARAAMANLKVRGRENKSIEDAVALAVTQLINGKTGQQAKSVIQNSVKLKIPSRRIALIILYWYATKTNVKSLAIAGGPSQAAINAKEAEFLKLFSGKQAAATPTQQKKVSPVSPDRIDNPTLVGQKQVTTPTLTPEKNEPVSQLVQAPEYKPPVSLSTEIIVKIQQGMSKSRPANISGPVYSKAVNDVLDVALRIYQQMALRRKIDIMNNWYFAWRLKEENYKYNGLRNAWTLLSGNADPKLGSVGTVPDAY